MNDQQIKACAEECERSINYPGPVEALTVQCFERILRKHLDAAEGGIAPLAYPLSAGFGGNAPNVIQPAPSTCLFCRQVVYCQDCKSEYNQDCAEEHHQNLEIQVWHCGSCSCKIAAGERTLNSEWGKMASAVALGAKLAIVEQQNATLCASLKIKADECAESWKVRVQVVQANAALRAVEVAVIDLGKGCAVGITGDYEDAFTVKTTDVAFKAIGAALKLGVERNDESNALRAEVEKLKREREDGTACNDHALRIQRLVEANTARALQITQLIGEAEERKAELAKAQKAQLAVELFGQWLDVNISKRDIGKAHLIGAWDEARDPGCHGGEYITKKAAAKARAEVEKRCTTK